METTRQKNKMFDRINIAGITIILLAVFSLGDVITTMAAKFKYEFFNETNPLFINGLSIELLLTIKLLLTGFIIFGLVKKYPYLPINLRYIFIYFITLITLLNIGVVINNIQVLQVPADQMLPMEESAKVEVYNEKVGNLGLVKPTPQTPLMVVMFMVNMCQYFVWRSFEKWKTKI